ncbi:MAG: GatB/YqeY domain-containing protein [Patescibacteria group bacterium]
MSLLDRISDDMKTAMKEKSEQALSTLRMVKAALKNKQIDLMRELADEDVITVLQTQSKQLAEALDGAIKAGRADLQEKAEAELAILKSYLPAELSDEELTAVIKEVLADIGETGKDIGKLMGLVMQKVKGRVNGQRVRQKVEEFLQK